MSAQRRPAPSAGSSRPDPRPGRSRTRFFRFLPALALLLGALGLFSAAPAQAEKIWRVNPNAYTVYEGVSARISLRLSEAAPAGGLGFTLRPLLGAAVPNDKCRTFRKASAADVGASLPTTLTVIPGSVRAEVEIPTAHDLIDELDECFVVQFAATQTIHVKLSEALSIATTVNIQIVPDRPATGRATETEDFRLSATTLSFAAGTTERTFTITGVADETTEGYDVHYTSAAAAAVGNRDAARMAPFRVFRGGGGFSAVVGLTIPLISLRSIHCSSSHSRFNHSGSG